MVVAAIAVGIAIALVTTGSSKSPKTAHRGARTVARATTSRASSKAATKPSGGAATSADLPRLVGQLIVGTYAGSQPDPEFLNRVKAGQLGGVIMFGNNIAAGLVATRRAIAALQTAARQGGNPPLLIMTDQEGGEVRRLPGAPSLSAAQMTSASVARSQGAAAGRLMRSVGVNVDLAPVADVEPSPNFLGPRSFGGDAATVAARACAFARGLQSAGVAYTLKHFPGLGLATGDTDLERVTIDDPAAELRADYAAYRLCGSSDDALVMVSSAVYPTLSGSAPAVMSPEIYARELPSAIGQPGHLTISDALDTPAFAGERAPALHAIDAGLDLALYANAEAQSAYAYTRLLSDARRGAIPLSRLEAAVRVVESLKARLR